MRNAKFQSQPGSNCGRHPEMRHQSSWDRPGIEKDRASVESGLSTPLQRAAFNAARSRHSGDWLLAIIIIISMEKTPKHEKITHEFQKLAVLSSGKLSPSEAPESYDITGGHN